MSIMKLNDRISLIDLYDLGKPHRTGAYVIAEEELTIVETSASPSLPHLKKGLQQLGYSLKDISYIIVTHIHLDHAGGVGLLLQDCPQAKVVVHPKGARHLINPSRLEAGARAVYREKFDELFHPIVPVPEENIVIKGDQDTLTIGKRCTLQFYDTPGHANHHFSIYDPVSNGMFTGDTAGIFYDVLQQQQGISLYLPSTSPNQFDPERMRKSIQLYKSKQLNYIYYGHFGMTKDVSTALDEVERWLNIFINVASEWFDETKGWEENVQSIYHQLFAYVEEELRTIGVLVEGEWVETLKLDLHVSAMGMVDYFIRNNTKSSTK
ncbi:MBL fold metallo-hydrolase [Aeribacillus pallidus]|uniref:MBL fold metallo-hydrolase n=1 Tax=Aeribacillus pallidus TaxID=33936 RepID=UPI003D238A16